MPFGPGGPTDYSLAGPEGAVSMPSGPKPDVPPMMTSTTVAVESDASPHQSSTPS